MKTFLTGILLFSTIILGGCGNHLSINEEQLNQDLLGRSITVDDESIEITRENLKKAEVVDTQEVGEQGKVFADIRVEVLEEEKGEKNKQERRNHINHIYTGNIVVEYTKFDKQWRSQSVSIPSPLSSMEEEVDNLIDPIPPLQKSKEDILDDLQNDYTGDVLVSNGDDIEEDVTFLKDPDQADSSSSAVTSVNKFEVVSDMQPGTYDLEKYITVKTDIHFVVENAFDMYDENGSYHANGEFLVFYHLIENEETGDLGWQLAETVTKKPFDITVENKQAKSEH